SRAEREYRGGTSRPDAAQRAAPVRGGGNDLLGLRSRLPVKDGVPHAGRRALCRLVRERDRARSRLWRSLLFQSPLPPPLRRAAELVSRDVNRRVKPLNRI